MASSLKNQKALTKRFLEVEAAWDQEGNIALRTDDCTYLLTPRALGHPVRNNQEFKEFYDQLKPVWSNYTVVLLPTSGTVSNY
jgi:hypothetical protein